MEATNLTKERIEKYLLEGKRFDGRKKDEFRDIKIETGISKNAEGSARVILGKTEVLVGVKMDIGTPYPDSPDKGNLITSGELLPLSSDRYENGPPRFPAIELGRIIDRGIRESKVIDFEKLCIKEGEKVWSVYIDIYSINDDGNIVDAAGIGALAALITGKMPYYDEKEEKIDYEKESKKEIPLNKDAPFTISVYKIGGSLIVDPTLEEEDASETKMIMGVREGGIISSIQKSGAKELTIDEVDEIFEIAEKVYNNTFPKIQKQLK
ncbi:MAG: exosome complex protein Rrp42 [Nanoarchaeota archaeon]